MTEAETGTACGCTSPLICYVILC